MRKINLWTLKYHQSIIEKVIQDGLNDLDPFDTTVLCNSEIFITNNE